MFLADFHVHSTFSDGKMELRKVIDLYGSRGFGAVAITDHICETGTLVGRFARILRQTLTLENYGIYLQTLREESERAWDQYQMIVIPGYELSKNSPSNHRSAHILALGVTDFLSADGDVLDVVRAAKASGALTVAAHPVSTRRFEKQTYLLWDRRAELRHEFDAWEVASGPYLFDEVKNEGLPLIASSDLHVPSQISSWKTVMDCERHPEAILDAIRKQKISFAFYQDKAPVTIAA